MRPEDAIRITHKIEMTEAAETFTRRRARSDLDTDKQLAYALARAVEIFGEAASKVSGETRRRLPAVAWVQAINMRHRLAHAYFGVDLDILWATATQEMPAILPLLRDALAADPPER